MGRRAPLEEPSRASFAAALRPLRAASAPARAHPSPKRMPPSRLGRQCRKVLRRKTTPPLGVFGFVPLAHASGTKHFIRAGPRHASRTKPVSIGILAVLAKKSRRNDSRFFFLSIFGSSPPAKRFKNHFASAEVKHILYPEQQGTVASRGRVRYQGDDHRAQVTQVKGCAVGISVYAGDDANNCSMFQVSVLWPVTLEMCEFEPGQGRGGAARSRKPWRRVQKAVGPVARRCMTKCTTNVSPGLSIIPSESSSRQEDGGGVGTCTSFCEHNTRLPHTHDRRLRSLAGAKKDFTRVALL